MATDWAELANLAMGIGSSLYGAYDNASQNDAYVRAIRDREQRNYDDGKANYDAYQEYLKQWGVADSANAAADASAASARSAAAAATERNRQAAAKKAQKVQNKAFKKAEGELRPYADAGRAVLPGMQQAYTGGLQGLASLAAAVGAPDRRALLNTPTSNLQTNFQLPSYLRYA